MKRPSAESWRFWIGSLAVLLTVACTRTPDLRPETAKGIISTLFRVEGSVGEETIRGARMYLHAGPKGEYLMVVLTLTNAPVLAVSSNGSTASVVNYRERTAEVDLPVEQLIERLPFPIRPDELTAFYRLSIQTGKPATRKTAWGTIMVTDRGRVVVLGRNGDRLLLTPIKGPETNAIETLALPIPAGYRLIHEPHHSMPR